MKCNSAECDIDYGENSEPKKYDRAQREQNISSYNYVVKNEKVILNRN